MIELIRKADCSECDQAEQLLDDLLIAHKVIEVASGEHPSLPPGTRLPALRDGDTVLSGAEAISSYAPTLERLLAQWSRFQGDSCYIDADGSVC